MYFKHKNQHIWSLARLKKTVVVIRLLGYSILFLAFLLCIKSTTLHNLHDLSDSSKISKFDWKGCVLAPCR